MKNFLVYTAHTRTHTPSLPPPNNLNNKEESSLWIKGLLQSTNLIEYFFYTCRQRFFFILLGHVANYCEVYVFLILTVFHFWSKLKFIWILSIRFWFCFAHMIILAYNFFLYCHPEILFIYFCVYTQHMKVLLFVHMNVCVEARHQCWFILFKDKVFHWTQRSWISLTDWPYVYISPRVRDVWVFMPGIFLCGCYGFKLRSFYLCGGHLLIEPHT